MFGTLDILKIKYMKAFCIKKPGMSIKDSLKVIEEIEIFEFGKTKAYNKNE